MRLESQVDGQTIFNRKLLPVITVRNITLVLGVAASEVANRERFNVVESESAEVATLFPFTSAVCCWDGWSEVNHIHLL